MKVILHCRANSVPHPTMLKQAVDPDEDAADEERHASNLELFLDLVFVFSVRCAETIRGALGSSTRLALAM